MENEIFIREHIDFYDSIRELLSRLPENALFVVDQILLASSPILQEYLCNKKVYVLHALESNKNLKTVESVYEFLMEHQRTEPLVGIGGGITGDIAGFAAATFKRGIPFILVPTTLLSMCDSTAGGKCGVNFRGVKNYIGVFKKPDEIHISIEFLKTVDLKELKSGMGELIKYGLIGKTAILDNLLEENSLQSIGFQKYVELGLQIKLDIVTKDYLDQGIRNILNFGHNIGHGLEALFPDQMSHGEAVALGLLVELKLSEELLQLPGNYRKTVRELMHRFQMSTSIPNLHREELMKFIQKDKKNDNSLRFTLLRDLGRPEVKIAVEENLILTALKEIMG